jgi:hypothetical protein
VGEKEMILLHDWVDWTNSGVGIAGLVLTFGAIWQATGAKTAACQAEKSVQSHHAETDFSTLVRMAKDLHGYVENGQLPEAKVRTTDLRTELSSSLERHKPFLGRRHKQLVEQQVSLKIIADGLNKETKTISHEERIRLLELTGAILEELAGQCGDLGSTVERSASYE